jgi:hypothetical protein
MGFGFGEWGGPPFDRLRVRGEVGTLGAWEAWRSEVGCLKTDDGKKKR